MFIAELHPSPQPAEEFGPIYTLISNVKELSNSHILANIVC